MDVEDNSRRSKVRCPYCKSFTEVREDRLERHVLRVHGLRSASKNPAVSVADRRILELIERSVSKISVSEVSRKGAVGARLGYLEKMGELLLPRAFAFADQAVLFTGNVPYEAHWLARLLPDDAKVRVDGEDPETTSFDVVVVGRTGFYHDRMRRVLASRKEPCRFLPQEGFLDELLFGRDWWNKESRLLNDTLVYHWGLQCSKDLFDSFARRYVNPEKRFRWPSSEIEETEKPALPDSIRRRTSSELWDLGYRITGMKRSERWERLCEAVAQLQRSS